MDRRDSTLQDNTLRDNTLPMGKLLDGIVSLEGNMEILNFHDTQTSPIHKNHYKHSYRYHHLHHRQILFIIKFPPDA